MSTFRLILAGFIFCVAIYLFISAPPPLPEANQTQTAARAVEVEHVFKAVNSVNDAARQIYTSRIVGPGKAVGLAFGEDWAEPGVEKGPLPALFLRLTAARLEAKPTRLSLYLGSDEPINKSNLFDAAQMQAFDVVKASQAPVFSEIEGVGVVGMFPDMASAQPCVTCHNEHEDSPKTDWQLGDVMGATTWAYPDAVLGADDYLATTEATFEAIAEAYGQYLDKVGGFGTSVAIGESWPDEGALALPSIDVFVAEVRAAASASIVDELILLSDVAAIQ